MRLMNVVAKKLRPFSPSGQGFWAGTVGVGRGRGRLVAHPKVSAPTVRDLETAVEEGKFIEVGGR